MRRGRKPSKELSYRDKKILDSYTISYAGRNQVDFPLDKDTAKEDAIIAADDNEDRANHKFLTNYVTVGLAVDSVDFTDFLDDFPEIEELGYLPVGPDSPYEPFRKLQVDY